jgi:hypothetical protein
MTKGLRGGLVLAVASAALVGCSGARSRTSPTGAPDIPMAAGDEGMVTQSGVEKVTICHIPPGNPGNAHTITVGAPAVPAHLAEHGDSIGPCPEPAPSPTPTPEPTPTPQ